MTKHLFQKGHKVSQKTKDKISKALKGKSSSLKGKNYEEIYGIVRAKEYRQKRQSELKGKKTGRVPKTAWKKGSSPWNKGIPCSEERKRKISQAEKGKKLSEETKRKISVANKGENNYFYGKYGELAPGWQGGKSFEPYGPKFNNKFKRAIRKRDNQVCILCGIHREKLNRGLDVHHINYDKKLTTKENCISLCRSCHTKNSRNRKHWTKFFQSLLNERYGYQYGENQEVIINLGVKEQ